MKKIFILFIIFSIITSVSEAKKVPKYIRERFTNCYSHSEIKSHDIEFNGYYDLIEISAKEDNKVLDTFYTHLIFYNDGTFLYNVVYNNAASLQLFFKLFREKTRNSNLSYGGDWGIFRISGDTIIAQFINNPVLFDVWSAWEIKFKIINKNTIKFINKVPLHRSTKQERDQIAQNLLKRNYLLLKFVPSYIPIPDSWLKKQKWAWCGMKIPFQ